MTLTADEFIRRFLIHVLPGGFHRIRHYGFLANPQRKELGAWSAQRNVRQIFDTRTDCLCRR